MKEILSYRDYSYMRKRWEKYLRHRKRKEPAWTEVMQVLEQFLPQMWSTLCRDEIFSETGCRIWNDIYKRLPSGSLYL